MHSRHVLAIALISACAAAQAGTPVFSDDFNSNTGALNAIPAGWTVTGGTVDIIPVGTQFDFMPGSGEYIDLDGSTQDAGLLSRSFSLLAGMTYTASFDLAGSHRGTTEQVRVGFGTASASYEVLTDEGWTGRSLSFTTTAAGDYTLSFQNSGGDNIGALLDNVTVVAVPEPSTYALMLAGLSAIGFIARRRRA